MNGVRRERPSILHLQLGQEVIYLLLAFFALLALVLATLVAIQHRRVTDAEQQNARNVQLGAQVEALQRRIGELGRAVTEEKTANRRLLDQLAILRELLDLARKELSDKPPIITLVEGKDYTFALGDASLTGEFRRLLGQEVVPKLERFGKQYRVQIIEVIGHTDELPLPERLSNLDGQLVRFLHADGALPRLIAGDNTGLGMARAASVVQFLMSDQRLKNFRILPLSAGQVINTDQSLSKGGVAFDAKERRRIEIRTRRLD